LSITVFNLNASVTSGSAPFLSLSSSVPVGSLCCVAVWCNQATGSGFTGFLTDTKGNNYILRTSQNNIPNNSAHYIFTSQISVGLTSSDQIIFNISPTNPSAVTDLSACYVLGHDTTNPIDPSTNTAADFNTIVSISSLGNPQLPNSLFLADFGWNAGGTDTTSNPSGWTTPPFPSAGTGNIPRSFGGYKFASTNQTYATTISVSRNWAGAILVIKPLTISDNISESANSIDVQSSLANLSDNISESANSIDVQLSSVTLSDNISESANSIDVPSVNLSNNISENANSIDVQSSSVNLSDTISESANSIDVPSVNLSDNISESANSIDVPSVTSSDNISENITLTDIQSSLVDLSDNISENITLNDIIESTIKKFLSYNVFFNKKINFKSIHDVLTNRDRNII
jgi:hypothetical protein